MTTAGRLAQAARADARRKLVAALEAAGVRVHLLGNGRHVTFADSHGAYCCLGIGEDGKVVRTREEGIMRPRKGIKT